MPLDICGERSPTSFDTAFYDVIDSGPSGVHVHVHGLYTSYPVSSPRACYVYSLASTLDGDWDGG